jgi:hypothetical protein
MAGSWSGGRGYTHGEGVAAASGIFEIRLRGQASSSPPSGHSIAPCKGQSAGRHGNICRVGLRRATLPEARFQASTPLLFPPSGMGPCFR